ncbi:hypothetical protein BVY04_00025 [bacterium M21]|nr:hypothetical protein BVY04_00025 [bacterium M21]
MAAELCALLAFSAIKNNDKVGLIVFTDQIEMFIAPRKGTSHVLRLIRELLTFKPRQAQTNINVALDYLGKVLHRRAVVFLISDFQSEDYEKPLRVLNKRHDLVALSVTDPRELDMPDIGLVELEDAETGERILIDTSSAAVRGQYKGLGARRSGEIKETFRKIDVDHTEIVTGHNYVKDLVGFFKTREKRAQH